MMDWHEYLCSGPKEQLSSTPLQAMLCGKSLVEVDMAFEGMPFGSACGPQSGRPQSWRIGRLQGTTLGERKFPLASPMSPTRSRFLPPRPYGKGMASMGIAFVCCCR